MASGKQLQIEVEKVAQQVAQVAIDKTETETEAPKGEAMKFSERLASVGKSMDVTYTDYVKAKISDPTEKGQLMKNSTWWEEPDGSRLMLRVYLVKRSKEEWPPNTFENDESVEEAFDASGYEERVTYESDEEAWKTVYEDDEYYRNKESNE